jgi:23S rRNA pseudouridine2604 synthase
MRINKFFTEHGYCSRREADRLIESGRVKINGRVALLGDQVLPDDKVYVDDKIVTSEQKKVYLMYNKPRGITCTTEKDVRGNIIDAVNYPSRIFMIGRLDKDSTGLIFLTNDGDIVNKILRAQFGHEKEYIVEINQPVTDQFLKLMSSGVNIGDTVTKPCRVNKIKGNTFSIILTEGKNRQIRRMCETCGATVKNLHRIRIMNVRLDDLGSGQWQEIPKPQFEELQKRIQMADGGLPRVKMATDVADDVSE